MTGISLARQAIFLVLVSAFVWIAIDPMIGYVTAAVVGSWFTLLVGIGEDTYPRRP